MFDAEDYECEFLSMMLNGDSVEIEREYFWTMKNGEKINVDDMTESHLRNVLKLLIRRSEEV